MYWQFCFTQSALLWVICFHCCCKPNFWNRSWSQFGVFDGSSSFSSAAFSHYLHPFVQLSFAIWSQVEGTSSLERHFRTSSWLNLFCFPLSSPLMLLYKLKKKHASMLPFRLKWLWIIMWEKRCFPCRRPHWFQEALNLLFIPPYQGG